MPMAKRPIPSRLPKVVEPPNDVATFSTAGAIPTPLSYTAASIWYCPSSRSAEVDPDLRRARLNGVVDVLAERRGRVVVADVPKRLNQGLAEEERNGRVLLQDASKDGLAASRRVGGPVHGARIGLFLLRILFGGVHGCCSFACDVGYSTSGRARLAGSPIRRRRRRFVTPARRKASRASTRQRPPLRACGKVPEGTDGTAPRAGPPCSSASTGGCAYLGTCSARSSCEVPSNAWRGSSTNRDAAE